MLESDAGYAIRDPSISTLTSIAEVLGTTTDWLYSGAGEAPTPEHVAASVARARAAAKGAA